MSNAFLCGGGRADSYIHLAPRPLPSGSKTISRAFLMMAYLYNFMRDDVSTIVAVLSRFLSTVVARFARVLGEQAYR